MPNLISIGDATVDTFLAIDNATLHCDVRSKKRELCLNYAEKIPIQHGGQTIGGNAANVAVGAARLGLDVILVSDIGDDINGLTIKQTLEEEGVNTDLVRAREGQETRYSVILNFRGERTVLSYYGNLTHDLPNLPSADWIYYSSLGKGFERVQKKLVAFLQKNPQTKLAVNPGSFQMNEGLSVFKEILDKTEILFVNKEEAQKIVGLKKNAPALLKKIIKTGVKIAVITDGSAGAFAADEKQMFHLPAIPMKVISKTGAGDAFASGFLSARFHGLSMEKALLWGMVNSASVIGQWGAHTGLLNKKSILKNLSAKNLPEPKPIQ